MILATLLTSSSSWAIQGVPRRFAPSLEGGGEWFNTAGPIGLAHLRGKIVILDFWTYCCINCLQTLPVLKQVEEAFPNEVVVLGIHSPKFFNERDDTNIREAIVRHDIRHPVLNDANAIVARKYNAQAWPSIRIIDPQGYLIAAHSGETTFAALHGFLKKVIATFKRNGQLDETPLRFDLEKYEAKPTPLRFPGKVLADASTDRLYIADSGHHRIVVTTLAGKLLDTIGSGQHGREDGGFDDASFALPQGLALLGNSLLVADTENHLIRRVDLLRKRVSTLAGTGRQSRRVVARNSKLPTAVDLASPWDLWTHQNELYIAMAGMHQIWKMSFGSNPRIRPYAGNGTEDVVDGRLLPRSAYRSGYASFAQPSGLSSDGRQLFIADSEGSSIRAVPYDPNGRTSTLLGTARLPRKARLFTFGDIDGHVNSALLQHPLAVAYADNRLYVADTYNNKIKAIDLGTSTITTIAGDQQPGESDDPPRFNEPAGLSLADSKLYVADTNNHLIRVIDLPADFAVTTLDIRMLKPPEPRGSESLPRIPGARTESFDVAAASEDIDQLKVVLKLELAPGMKLNQQAPMSFLATVTDGDKILAPSVDGKKTTVDEPSTTLELDLPLAKSRGSARLSVGLIYFYCHEGAEGLCRIGSVTWVGPVKFVDRQVDQPITLRHEVR
jgi:thiol-disulfide isomerase/thioredoxin/sugar lactone lactonase YvrE